MRDPLDPEQKPSLLGILLIPFQILFAIVVWIVGVWMYLVFLAIGVGIPVAIGLTLWGAVFGGGDGDNDRGGGNSEYSDMTAIALESTADAMDEWSALMEQHADIDPADISQNEARELIQDELDAARKTRKAITEGLDDIRVIAPPQQCEGAHLAVIESLQLAERGFNEVVSFLGSALSSGVADSDSMDRGNDLLSESDRVKAGSLNELEECLGVSLSGS